MTDYATLEFGCPYFPAYSGRCNRPKGPSGFCPDHAAKRCSVCGAQATNECSHTGQFVCGAPLCDDCEGWVDTTKPGGAWGTLNHAHRRKPVEKRRHEARPATAADFGLPDDWGER